MPGPYDDDVVDELFAGEREPSHLQSLHDASIDPLPTPNQRGFKAYLGPEQHGVRFAQENEGITTWNRYAGEQQAFDDIVSDTTVRDINPLKPLAVRIVDSPDLIYRKFARATTYNFASTDLDWHQVLQADPLRKRALIRVRTTGGFYIFALSPEQNPSDMTAVEISGSSGLEVLDTTMTSPLFVKVLGGDGNLRVSVWTEYQMYDGEPLGVIER